MSSGTPTDPRAATVTHWLLSSVMRSNVDAVTGLLIKQHFNNFSWAWRCRVGVNHLQSAAGIGFFIFIVIDEIMNKRCWRWEIPMLKWTANNKQFLLEFPFVIRRPPLFFLLTLWRTIQQQTATDYGAYGIKGKRCSHPLEPCWRLSHNGVFGVVHYRCASPNQRWRRWWWWWRVTLRLWLD